MRKTCEQIMIPGRLPAIEKRAVLDCIAEYWPAAVCEREECDADAMKFFGIMARGQVDCDFSKLSVYKDESAYQLWERKSPETYRENTRVRLTFDGSETTCVCPPLLLQALKKIFQRTRKNR